MFMKGNIEVNGIPVELNHHLTGFHAPDTEVTGINGPVLVIINEDDYVLETLTEVSACMTLFNHGGDESVLLWFDTWYDNCTAKDRTWI